MRNRILEFIDYWLGLIERDRARVFNRLVRSNRISLRRRQLPRPESDSVATWSVVWPQPGGRTIEQVIGEPLIIGGWD